MGKNVEAAPIHFDHGMAESVGAPVSLARYVGSVLVRLQHGRRMRLHQSVLKKFDGIRVNPFIVVAFTRGLDCVNVLRRNRGRIDDGRNQQAQRELPSAAHLVEYSNGIGIAARTVQTHQPHLATMTVIDENRARRRRPIGS